MITEGNKIKMKKSIPGFDYIRVGDEFTVVSVSDAVITFRSDNYKIGTISHEGFKEYFQIVPEYEWIKWLEWTRAKDESLGTYMFKTKDKKVLVYYRGYKGWASCHPDDDFDLETGIQIALSRALVKYVFGDNKKIDFKLVVQS